MDNVAATLLAAVRSFEPLDSADLRHLAELAAEDLKQLFVRHPDTGRLYQDRLLMLCLCQGGAEHFVRQKNGVKDLDVWAFFSEHPARPFPYRRRGIRDFGPSRHGRHPDDEGFMGRRVDIIGRSIKCGADQSAQDCIRGWLGGGKTDSAKLIAMRPVVAVYPENERGNVIWDPAPATTAVRTA